MFGGRLCSSVAVAARECGKLELEFHEQKGDRSLSTEGTPRERRQVVRYAFYKLDPAWRRLPAAEQQEHKAAFVAAVDDFHGPADRPLLRARRAPR